MRRRPPRLVQLSSEDLKRLKEVVHDGHVEQRIARRARILLAMAEPDTIVQDLAHHFGIDRTSIWSLCRRFEAQGLRVLEDAPRPGRPPRLSPPATRPG